MSHCYVVLHHLGAPNAIEGMDGRRVIPYVVFQDAAPTLESFLIENQEFNANWRGTRPELPQLDCQGNVIVEGEVEDTNTPIDPNAPTQMVWTEPEDPTHRFEVTGPFNAPKVATTYQVIRPGAETPLVIVQAYKKRQARSVVAQKFGRCPGTRAIPLKSNPAARIIAPIL